MNVDMDKGYTLITETSASWGRAEWPSTNEYSWKEYGCCGSRYLTSKDQNTDPFDIWKLDPSYVKGKHITV